MSHPCPSLTWFVQASTVDCLEDGAWIIVHCGQMRNHKHPSGGLCDIPFEVKKILSDIPGVKLQVSSKSLLATSCMIAVLKKFAIYMHARPL